MDFLQVLRLLPAVQRVCASLCLSVWPCIKLVTFQDFLEKTTNPKNAYCVFEFYVCLQKYSEGSISTGKNYHIEFSLCNFNTREMELLPVCIQETSSVFPPTFPQKTMTVAVVLCAGGRGGQGVQRGWLCEGGYRAPYGHDCPRVRPEDKPHVT